MAKISVISAANKFQKSLTTLTSFLPKIFSPLLVSHLLFHPHQPGDPHDNKDGDQDDDKGNDQDYDKGDDQDYDKGGDQDFGK